MSVIAENTDKAAKATTTAILNRDLVANEIAKFKSDSTRAITAANKANQSGAWLVARIMDVSGQIAAEATASFEAICKDEEIPPKFWRDPLALLPQAVAMLGAGATECPPAKYWKSGPFVAGVVAMAGSTLKAMADDGSFESALSGAVEAATETCRAENAKSGRRAEPTQAEIAKEITRNRPKNASGSSNRKAPKELLESLVEAAIAGDIKAAEQLHSHLLSAVDKLGEHLAKCDAAKDAIQY